MGWSTASPASSGEVLGEGGEPLRGSWALSAARAANVVNRMNTVDAIYTSRLSALGYGVTHPEVPNTTAANRAINRRVDVVILNS